ncbi:MAG: polysaccharide biosynthesis protein [Thermoprotei archaeon]|nr:MAG: polysaccharide biosynthesis protein [Thermoprotei archaeon]
MTKKSILLIASGGGHTGYCRALAERFYEYKKNYSFKLDAVIPCLDKWSKKILEDYVDNIFCINKLRQPYEKHYKMIKNFPIALIQSIKRIKRYDYVIASGSNHSLLPTLIAKLKNTSSKILAIESHDRFITRGKTISLLSKTIAIPILHWKEQKKLYRNGIVVGPIVKKRKYEISNKGYVLVIGGFEGDKKLYDKLVKTPLTNVVLQTGRLNPEHYRKLRPDWIVFDFDPDIDKWIAGARVVIGHTSVTLLEAAITYRKPVIIYWNPEWSSAATFQDVILFSKKINAQVLVDTDPNTILETINKVKPPPDIREDGAKKLVKLILESKI